MMDFDFNLFSKMIHAESASLTITNNGAVGLTKGVPNGWVRGSTTAEGQIVLDTQNAALLKEEARKAGSYEDLPLTDFVAFAGDSSFSEKIEIFGVKLVLTEVFNGETSGGSKVTKTYAFHVTHPDFIKIDGVPILSINTTREIEANDS